MKNFFRLLIVFLVFIPCSLMAQDNTVTGKVIDESNGSALVGATVKLKGTQKGTATSKDGEFTLSAPGKGVLIVSNVGYVTMEMPINGRGVVDIALKVDNSNLNEVVVIGYLSKKRKDLTGAVTTVNGDDLKNIPIASPDQLLQGKAPGVQISSMSGTPGGGVSVNVRGTSSFSPNSPASQPLYIIDGIFVNNTPLSSAGYGTEQQYANPLADLNPSDIETISILKDANATSIYGSRGANGVVIITTKRGKLNSKSKINFNTYYGQAKPHRLPQVTNGPQTATLLNEVWINNGNSPTELPYPDPASLPTYNRIPYMFDNNAPTSNIDLNITGGGAKTTFYLGGTLFKQEGIVRPLSFDRGSIRLNLDHQVNKNLRISTSNTIVRTHREIVANDNSTGVMLSGIGLSTLYPTFNSDGSYNYNTPLPNAVVQIKENDETSTGTRLISNVFAEYQIIPKLYFKSSWSVDFNDAMNRAFNSTILNGPGQPANGYNANNRQITWINEQTLRYSFNAGDKHQFNALIGNSAQKTTLNSFAVGASNYPNDDLRFLSAASQADFWSGGEEENTLVSVFGRVDYTFNDKYILDFNMRGDASSKFGANNRWGIFPGAGFAWKMIEESFMKTQHIFSDLKLKTSYGITGSQESIADYASKGLWTGNDNYLGQPGTRPSQLANPNLKWEQTSQFNIGVEFSLFGGVIDGEFDYYNKLTKGMLINQPVPTSTGFSSIASNAGDISNKGVELGLNAHLVREKDFSWDVGFNISHNKNLIVKLDIPYFEPFSRKFILFEQGHAVNSFWLWKQLKVDPATGDAVYEDVDKNGVIDDRDRLILGDNQPKLFGGLNSTLRYKGFDFSFLFNFETGQSIVNWSTFFMVHGGNRSNASTGKATWGFYSKQLERWQNPGDITDIPRMGGPNKQNNYGRYTSRALEDGSYARLKNISLGYSIPTTFISKIGLNNARIYFSATNLLTFTKYSGLDPEINAGGGKGTVGGVEMFTVPQPETWQAGLSITF